MTQKLKTGTLRNSLLNGSASIACVLISGSNYVNNFIASILFLGTIIFGSVATYYNALLIKEGQPIKGVILLSLTLLWMIIWIAVFIAGVLNYA